ASMNANSGVKSIVSTGAMFSTTRCLDSTSQAATTTPAAPPPGSPPRGIRPGGVPAAAPPRRLEDPGGQGHQPAAAECHQHVVDEPLAREADEVHAPLVRSDRPAHVRERDHKPGADGQSAHH